MSNTLSFDRLQQGLQKISDLGLIEETLEVHGIDFCLRTLRTKDHKSVNAFVGAYMAQYESEESAYPLDATMDFFTVRKIEPLTHSIQAIGDLDFHGIEYIETGAFDGNGNPIKKEKHVFVRELLRDMDIAVIEVLHRKYSDLFVVAEERAAAKVKFRDPEEELAQIERRREDLYRELERPLPETVEPTSQKAGESTPSKNPKDDLTIDALKEAAFTPVAKEQAAEMLRERAEVNEDSGARIPEKQQEDEEDPEDPEEFEAGGQKFIRLDDPDTPYTEEEQVYLEEQERMFNQRYGDESEEAKAQLQKRRRQPLNQTAPQIHEGSLPSKERQRPTRVRRGSQDSSKDLPIAEGFEEQASSVLGPPKSGGPKKPSYNQAPSGTRNPHFKDPTK